ncbi:nitroreductase family deazaflavin-dependent oxidoreductase [Streptomyces sp. BBFR102]|uniref:nitroreductase family deazaflavin-dependent oxidoreductase n=1 Tax=Streptomyces sp. BBFR102 TaxID=3448171 RepID=UPI003F52C287
MPTPYYLKATPLAARLNSLVGRLARYGVSFLGSAELTVVGRRSGDPQRIPVNPHTHEGAEYLVSARGHSQWVRNMRAAGGGELRLGRRTRSFLAEELPDGTHKAAVLRTYLSRWGWEVNQYFQGVTADSTDSELLAACPDHPVFRITGAEAGPA